MGVSSLLNPFSFSHSANMIRSITKLMGESFKLHAQALVGYEDAVMAEQANGTPVQPMAPHAAEIAAY